MNLKYNWQTYHWAIEPSSKCALKCPRCPRTEYPEIPWLNRELTLEQFKQVFTPEIIEQRVQRFTMCGDVGDPIYCNEYLDIIDYIKSIKRTCHIFTITNGSYKPTSWWRDFAAISNAYDTINFSVDGFNQDSNNKYRVNSDFDSIMNGMHIMGHESPAFVYYAVIYFRFNQDKLDLIRAIARDANCDGIQWTKSTKFNSKYKGQYGHIDLLQPDPKFISTTDRYERHIEPISGRSIGNTHYLDTNKQRYIEYMIQKPVTPLCMIGNRGMFLNVEGVVHPCGWVSFPYDVMSNGKKEIRYEDSFFKVNKEHFNAIDHSLETVLNNPLWEKLFMSWKTDPFVECSLKCDANLVDYNYAVGYETN